MCLQEPPDEILEIRGREGIELAPEGVVAMAEGTPSPVGAVHPKAAVPWHFLLGSVKQRIGAHPESHSLLTQLASTRKFAHASLPVYQDADVLSNEVLDRLNVDNEVDRLR